MAAPIIAGDEGDCGEFRWANGHTIAASGDGFGDASSTFARAALRGVRAAAQARPLTWRVAQVTATRAGAVGQRGVKLVLADAYCPFQLAEMLIDTA